MFVGNKLNRITISTYRFMAVINWAPSIQMGVPEY